MRQVLPCVLLCLCSFLTLPVTLLAGNVLDRTGNPTATPLVAFSLRQLSSAYTGNAIQVRRSSDNAAQDIGFTTAGDLDTIALKAFVGNGDGYVSIWYDQSGNGYNATQITIAIQPTIMSSGVINRDNGQPSVYTSGSTGFLQYGPISQLNGNKQVTRMEVTRSRSSTFAITEGLGNFQLDLQLFPNQVFVQFETNNIASSGAVSSITALMSINSIRNDAASQLYVNAALLGTTATTLNAFNNPMGYIGVRFDYYLHNDGPGAFSETILFNSVLSDADRQSINCNQNGYYSLGIAPCSSTLPIIISSFTGRRVNETTGLSWTTQSESNSEWFYIQRSADGSTWKTIGLEAAAGNSNIALFYQFTDIASLQEGNKLYYRLKLVDIDGRYTYSGIVLVKMDNMVIAPQLRHIVPNPFERDMEISCTVAGSGSVEVQLQDITGTTLIRRKYIATKGDNVWKLTNLDRLARGTYIVRVVQGGVVGIGKVIKQ
jgi:hypothetical protein